MNATLVSPFYVSEMISSYETWIISVQQKTYIHLKFEIFDIGCQAGSALEVIYSPSDNVMLCNRQNRPVFPLISGDNRLEISLYIFKKPGELINQFTAEYFSRSLQEIEPGQLTNRRAGIFEPSRGKTNNVVSEQV